MAGATRSTSLTAASSLAERSKPAITITPVVTNASGLESEAPVDRRRQYGIESPVRSVIDRVKLCLTLSHSDTQSAPHSGWTHLCARPASSAHLVADERERGLPSASSFAGMMPLASRSRKLRTIANSEAELAMVDVQDTAYRFAILVRCMQYSYDRSGQQSRR
eukprot:scaffold77655_cov64-Phaeocystis_antarctica.AAC.5